MVGECDRLTGMRSEPTTRVCVYCGSNAGTSPSFGEAAHQLGSALAHRGIGLVYGGGHVGLMGLVADAALAADGEVIGVITEQLVRAEVAHDGLTRLEVVPTTPSASSIASAAPARSAVDTSA